MIDLHLINIAVASLGIGAGAVLLIAAVIIAIAALGRHGPASRRSQPTVRTPAASGGPVSREPALR